MRIQVAALALLLSISATHAQQGRTFVDRLALDTPEQAVASFLDAFGSEDFVTAYAILSPAAKQGFLDNFYQYNVARLVLPNGVNGWIAGSIHSPVEGLSPELILDSNYDTALTFDNIVFHAKRNGQMPFNLSNARIVTIGDIADGKSTVSVVAGATDIGIETVLTYSGDWKVDRISWPGSDPEARPWGIFPAKTKP